MCVLCAQSSPISEEEEGKKQMAGLPASHSYAPRNGKSVYIVWSVCVYGPLLLSASPPPPIPSRPPGMEITSTKQKSPRLYYPIPCPEGQQQQLLLLHANGTIHYGNGARCPCEVHVEELIFFFSSCRQIDKINQIHSKIIMKQTVTAMNRDWRVGENFAKLKLGRI